MLSNPWQIIAVLLRYAPYICFLSVLQKASECLLRSKTAAVAYWYYCFRKRCNWSELKYSQQVEHGRAKKYWIEQLDMRSLQAPNCPTRRTYYSSNHVYATKRWKLQQATKRSQQVGPDRGQCYQINVHQTTVLHVVCYISTSQKRVKLVYYRCRPTRIYESSGGKISLFLWSLLSSIMM